MTHFTDFDVIVIGGGGSGLAAAVSAAEQGARVLLLEKNPQLGGTTGIAVGSFTASRTSLQREAGIEDAVPDHCADAGRFPPPEIEAKNNAQLREFFLSHAAETFEWLRNMGLTFHGPSPEPPNRVSRMHNVVPNAKAYIAVLQSRLLRLGGVIRCHASVTELLMHAGRISRVRADVEGDPREFTANRGVVLATGDYANSSRLIAEYKGDQFSRIEGINPFATGEGHDLARSVGAKLLNMDVTYGPEIRFEPPPGEGFHQLLPTQGPLATLMGRLLPWVPRFLIQKMIQRLLVTWQHPETALFDDGAILVNSRGERFCDETAEDSWLGAPAPLPSEGRSGSSSRTPRGAAWPDREIAIAGQPDKRCYILLDERLIERYSQWPHFISTAPEIAYAYVADYLRLRPDVAVEAGDLERLAARRGLPADRLAQAVSDYNASLSSESSSHSAGRQPLQGSRWVLLGPARAYFTTTEGGAAITQQCEVLDEQGEPIPGLYAVGQIGLGGQILWGHGLHIAWALTSGRLVGRIVGRQP